jgi:hypothetical protein
MAVAALIISLISLLVAVTANIRSRQEKAREELINLLDGINADLDTVRNSTSRR